MFQFFDQIGNIISSVVDYVVIIFQNLFNFFTTIFNAMSFVIQICVALPLPIQAACLCIIGVSVIYLIVGR